VRVGVHEPLGQADRVHELERPLLDRVVSAEQPVLADGLGDEFHDALARVERGKRVLEDHGHLGAQAAHPTLAVLGDVLAVEDDLAGGRLDELEDRPAGRGLAAARLADDAERLALLDLEADAVDGMQQALRRVEVLGQVVDFQKDFLFILSHGCSSSGRNQGHCTRRRRHSAYRPCGAAPAAVFRRPRSHTGSGAQRSSPRAGSWDRASGP